MNKVEYLLTKLSEECAEVIQRCTKAQTFGLTEKQPNQDKDNRERLQEEIFDLLGVLTMLHDEDIVNYSIGYYSEPIRKKRAKIKKYMDYSRQIGTLVEEKVEEESEGTWLCDCNYFNGNDYVVCSHCGKSKSLVHHTDLGGFPEK